jgi:hypothetical protein
MMYHDENNSREVKCDVNVFALSARHFWEGEKGEGEQKIKK